jgi:hypothetical protein
MNLRFTSVKLILRLAPASEPSFTAAFSLKGRSKTSSNEPTETHTETNDSKQFVRMREELLRTVHPNANWNGPPAFSVIVTDFKLPALAQFTLYKNLKCSMSPVGVPERDGKNFRTSEYQGERRA